MVDSEAFRTVEPIAIIGMAGRFPGAGDVGAFWKNLLNGVDATRQLGRDELLGAGVDAKIVDSPNYVRVAGVLDDIDLFDANFFHIPPSDADVMDPQQRLALECAWQVFDDAGYAPGATKGSVAVFMGASLSTYLVRNLVHRPDVIEQAGVTRVLLGNDKDHIATMISHYLRLRGPSIAVGSACSSSLTAVAMACQSLWTYQSDMAIAGGVGVQVPQPQGHFWQSGGIYSRDGRCRAFDEDAQGTVGGSGIGLILLKRLDEATADGDHIYALIRGAAVNNDGGGKIAYSAPSAAGQASVISEALMLAGVEPNSIGYVEAHGTGTSLGDAVEIAALSDVFAVRNKDSDGCALGSVKSAIGHLDAAAGVASLIKAALAVKHGQIPASLNFEKPNSQFDLRQTPFYVPRAKTPWPKTLSPRRAGVSSFGIGGTNAHVILEEPPALARSPNTESKWWILPLSAKTGSALQDYARSLATYLSEHPHVPIADVSFTLALGRHAFEQRAAVVCRDIGSAVRELEAIAKGTTGGWIGDASQAEDQVERHRHELLASAWNAGEDVDWTNHYAGKGCRRVPLPAYAFERRRFWIAPVEPASAFRLPTAEAARLPQLSDLLPALRDRQRTLSHELAVRPIASFPGLKPSLDGLCASHAYWFLRAYGLPAKGEPPITRAALETRLSAKPAMHRLLDYLLRILAQDGLIVATETGIHAGPSSTPPRPAAIAQQIKQHYPGFTGLLELIAHCVEGYARTFAAPVSAVEVLYPGGTADLLQRMLRDGTIEHTQTRLASRLVRALLEGLAERAHQPMRILEVGAGGGSLTAELAPALVGRNVNYHVSDISPAFVRIIETEARRRNFHFMTFGTLDITRSGESQGYLPESYDVILALNTLHATPSIPESLANLNALLAPGGILALIETVRPERWLNLIWGISEGWWSYADGLRDLGPLIDDVQWIEALRAQKLVDVASLPDDPAIAEPDAKLFVACKPVAKAAASAAPIPARQPEISDWFSAPSWERALEPAEPAAASTNENWLVFNDAEGVCDAVAEELKQKGGRVTVVLPGGRFAREKADLYRIHPDRPGDYHDLLLDLANDDRAPAHVVYGWPITAAETGGNGTDGPMRDYGFYSVLELVKALAGQSADESLDLVVLSNGVHDVIGDEPLLPFKSVLLGAVKIIPREYPNVSCRNIDIELPAGGALDAQIIRRLVKEMYQRSASPVVALRGRHAWQPVIRPMRLHAGARSGYLRPGGVFLVVGGLGGIGLSLAEVLAESPAAKIVLVARSAFPAAGSWNTYLAAAEAHDPIATKIVRLQAMQAAGAEIAVRSADVCDAAAMRALVLWIRQHYGALDGIIHAAGSPDTGGVIQRRSREATRSALAAKVEGVRALDLALDGTWPELTVLCSSIGSFLYNLKFGEIGYVAANDFLNAFAHFAARTHRGRFVTIDWTDWKEDGMWAQARSRLDAKYALLPSGKSQHAEPDAATIADDLLGALSTSEAKEAFRRVLAGSAPQVIVSTQRIDELLDRHSEFTTAHHKEFLEAMGFVRKSQARPPLRTPFVPPRTPTERRLAELWQKLLGIERIGVDDDFFELGGDSLLAIRILNSLNDEFGVADTLTGLLSVPTIARLADRVDNLGAHAAYTAVGTRPDVLSVKTAP